MARLVLGNRIDGGSPMNGSMRMFRVGNRTLGSYEYDTMDLSKLNTPFPGGGTFDRPKHIKVEEVKRYFDRAGKDGAEPPVITDPRMTTGAFAFITMDRDEDYGGVHDDGAKGMLWRRSKTDDMLVWPGDAYRSWGAQNSEQESIGLMFSLRQVDHAGTAYADNARYEVSNILWEFSPDGGRGRWYQLYELPNRERMRITLPEPTNAIRLRAVSSSEDEWVQSLAVSTYVDYQNVQPTPVEFVDDEISIDFFGYISWSGAVGGCGDIIYELLFEFNANGPWQSVRDDYTWGNVGDFHALNALTWQNVKEISTDMIEETKVLATTRGTALAPEDYDIPEGYTTGTLSVMAIDATYMTAIKSIEYPPY